MAENKVIVLRGIERTGADEIQTPGGLEQCIGMEAREGSLVPYAMTPKSNGRGCHYGSEDYDRILIHKTTNQQNVIFVGNGTLKYVNKADWDNSQVTPTLTAITEDYISVQDIEQIGNMLCVSTSAGIRYFLWKGNGYVEREASHPDLPMVKLKVERGLYNPDINLPATAHGALDIAHYEGMTVTTREDTLKAAMLSCITKTVGHAREAGGLVGYVLACAAWRLKNGSFVKASPIVLLGHTYKKHEDKLFDTSDNETIHRLISDNPETYQDVVFDWDDEAIMRPVSAGSSAIWGTTETFLDDTNDDFYLCVKNTGGTAWEEIYTSTISAAEMRSPLVMSTCNYYPGNSSIEANVLSTAATNTLSFKVDDTVSDDDISSLCIFISKEVFPFYSTEHEENFDVNVFDLNGTCLYQLCNMMPNLRPYSDVVKEITEITNLYKVEEIDVTNLTADTWVNVNLAGKLGDNLYVRETLPLTAWTYSEGLNGSLDSYNMRLHVFDYKQKIFGGFLYDEYTHNNAEFVEGYGNIDDGGQYPQDTETPSSLGGKFQWEIDVEIEDPESGQSIVMHYANNLDRLDRKLSPFIFFPDVNATKIRFRTAYTPGGVFKVQELHLTRWDAMQGAYYIDPELVPVDVLTGAATTPSVNFPIENNSNDSRVAKNGIRVSDTAYPTYFPAAYTYRVGDGEIVGLATLTNALNQDVFGPQPLLVFTSEGIWSMGVDSTGKGAYTTILPFSREVCISRKSICPIDGAVLFASKQGLMIANAQGVQEFCPALNGIIRHKPDATLQTGNGMKILSGAVTNDHLVNYTRININWDKVYPEEDFRDYLRTATVSYIAEKKKVIVYDKSMYYAYWIDIPTRIATIIPMQVLLDDDNYPSEVYYTDSAGYTAERLMPTNISSKCLLQTRPFRFNTSLQSLERVAVRGRFCNKNASAPTTTQPGDMVGIYVLGSLDGIYWRMIGGYEKPLYVTSGVANSGFHDLDCKVERETYNYAMVIVAGMLDVNSHIDAIELTIKNKYNLKLR